MNKEKELFEAHGKAMDFIIKSINKTKPNMELTEEQIQKHTDIFWEKFAKHNDDVQGLDRYLQSVQDNFDEFEKEYQAMSAESEERLTKEQKYV